MRAENHFLITEIIFGYPYKEVHEWIDKKAEEYFKSGQSPFNHWKHRHHYKAIEEKYGLKSIELRVALLHVLCDWLSHTGEFIIPEDEFHVLSELHSRGLIDRGHPRDKKD